MNIYKESPRQKKLLNVKLDGILNVPIPESYQVAGEKNHSIFHFTQDKQIPTVLSNDRHS